MSVAPVSASPAVKQSFHDCLNQENRAVYLPAISAGYAKEAITGLTQRYGNFGVGDLNFLDGNNPSFHYPYALYSAGQHSTGSGKIKVDMVSQRDRSSTLIVGDSGGFQIINDDKYFTQSLVLDNMRWMESVADFSAVLEFPTAGIANGKMEGHANRLKKAGHDLTALNAATRLGEEYHACLVQTCLNNDDFLRHRTPGATQFLNVLQGRNEAESSHWYQAVKHYPFEGWALAGRHQVQFSMTLARMIDLRDDGMLSGAKWIHFLGVGTMPIGVLLTTLLRALRRYNSDLQISFDTASPFRSGAFQNVQAGWTADREGWTMHTVPLRSLDRSANLGWALADQLDSRTANRSRRATRTIVSKSVNVADLFKPGTDDLSADGYLLMTHHNVEAMVEAHRDAHDLMFGDAFVRDPLAVPISLKTLAAMIEEIMASPTNDARQKIKDWRSYLDILSE